MEELARYLQNLAEDQHLISRAMEGFEACFANNDYMISGWKADEIQRKFDKHSFVFKHDGYPFVYIDTYLDLRISANEPLGFYVLRTTLDGEDKDDYLVFEYNKDEYEARLQSRKKR